MSSFPRSPKVYTMFISVERITQGMKAKVLPIVAILISTASQGEVVKLAGGVLKCYNFV